MRRFFGYLILVVLFCIGSILPVKSRALAFPSGHLNVQVGASIGEYYLDLSGFLAPFASIVLTTDNTVMRSVVADNGGYFSLSQILIRQGFSSFCLTGVDVKRLGQSEACFSIPPANGNITKTNIFLPPTIGLYRTQIQEGSNAIIWGYSMPGALVTVHSSDGKDYQATADNNGFYQVTAYIAKAGTYDLSATAVLKKQSSEKPTNKVRLVALTLAQATGQGFFNWLRNLITILFNVPLGPLWLAIPILILIFILWRKLKGKPLLPSIKQEKVFFDYLFRSRKLHHHYLHGVGY